ncbi:MAG: chloramphenicol acetyltransferase [Lachnospiraceae bacterium]|nr:chloramphenicol acetyltransferase [Lachnospiraceae bacterium]
MREIDPKQTKRAAAFELWMKAPMPMITIFKTLDVSNLVKISRKHGYKFNMLMCWCIGKAASQIEEFYLLPVDGKLMQYDSIAINTVVATKDGDINTCDIPFSKDLAQFHQDYLKLTHKVHDTCNPHDLDDQYMVIGTSALVQCEIDGAVNIYAGIYNNPFIIWGKYKRKLLKTSLSISFQFHHTQMDGGHAAQFLECLQKEITTLKL